MRRSRHIADRLQNAFAYDIAGHACRKQSDYRNRQQYVAEFFVERNVRNDRLEEIQRHGLLRVSELHLRAIDERMSDLGNFHFFIAPNRRIVEKPRIEIVNRNISRVRVDEDGAVFVDNAKYRARRQRIAYRLDIEVGIFFDILEQLFRMFHAVFQTVFGLKIHAVGYRNPCEKICREHQRGERGNVYHHDLRRNSGVVQTAKNSVDNAHCHSPCKKPFSNIILNIVDHSIFFQRRAKNFLWHGNSSRDIIGKKIFVAGGTAMKIFRSLKRSALSMAVCSTLLFGGAASAADQSAMDAFREAMTANNLHDGRMFREQIMFFTPSMKADVDFQGISRKENETRIRGKFTLLATDAQGNNMPFDVPFYIDRSKKDATLYFQLGNEWKKISPPKSSGAAVEAIGSSDEDIQKMISLVRNAEILQETTTQRTMRLDLDEAALTKYFTEAFSENDAELNEKERKSRDRFLKYLTQGLNDTDVQCTWTVDKNTWQTNTFSINLTGVIQGTARAALNDPNSDVNEMIAPILESLAYYSEFKAYTTYFAFDKKASIELPKEVKKATAIDIPIPDKK